MIPIKITSKEVGGLTGTGERNGCKIINQIKKKLGKNKEQYITKWEYAKYMKIDREEVEYALSLIKTSKKQESVLSY